MLSVLMPVYNCESYLDAAIRSIREQTFAEFEFVIVNDGSKDGSLEIINRHAEEDPRIVVLDRPNGGIVDALNAGLDVCRGSLVARMDADDLADSDRLQRQVNFLASAPEIGLVGTGVVKVDSAGRPFAIDAKGATSSQLIEMLHKGHTPLIHPTWMMRQELILQAGGYDPRFRHAEDYELLLRVSRCAALAILAEPLLSYRYHPGSISTRLNSIQREKKLEALRLHAPEYAEHVPAAGLVARPCGQFEFGRYMAHQALANGFTRTAFVYACRLTVCWPWRLLGWRLALRCLLGKRSVNLLKAIVRPAAA